MAKTTTKTKSPKGKSNKKSKTKKATVSKTSTKTTKAKKSSAKAKKTTKRTTKTSAATKKVATKRSSSVKKSSVKKSPATKKRTTKKTTKTVAKTSALAAGLKASQSKKTANSAKTTSSTKSAKTQVSSLSQFTGNRSNVIKVLILLLIIGAFYLIKDIFVVATVNGAPIFRWSVISRLEEQGGQQVLDSLVTEKLVDQEVKNSGQKIDQAEIDAALLDIETRLSSQGMDLDQALEEQGMTKQELIKDISLQKSVEKIVAENLEITDAEVDAYIEENSQFFPEGTDPDLIRESVREQLKSLSLNEKVQAWVLGLQNDANINYIREYKQVGF